MSICQFTSLFENYSQTMLRQLMSLPSSTDIFEFQFEEGFSEPKPVDTYQNVLKCSTGGRIRASPKRTKTETPLLSLLDKEAFSLDSISELDLKGDFMLDMTRGGEPPPMKKRKLSPTPKRFKSEPIPPLSLEHTVMLVSAVMDDEKNVSKTVSNNKPHILTDETIENMLRCV